MPTYCFTFGTKSVCRYPFLPTQNLPHHIKCSFFAHKNASCCSFVFVDFAALGTPFVVLLHLLILQFWESHKFKFSMGNYPGGYLVYLSKRDVLFLTVSLSPIFSVMGYRMNAISLELIVKTCQNKGKTLLHWVTFYFSFCVLEYTFHQFFLESGIT